MVLHLSSKKMAGLRLRRYDEMGWIRGGIFKMILVKYFNLKSLHLFYLQSLKIKYNFKMPFLLISPTAV